MIADQRRPHECVADHHDDGAEEEHTGCCEDAAALKCEQQRRAGKDDPGPERDHGERDGQKGKDKRAWDTGDNIGRADRHALATATMTVPFTVPRTVSTILLASRLARIAQQPVCGVQHAVAEPSAVLQNDKQGNQGNEKQERPMQNLTA